MDTKQAPLRQIFTVDTNHARLLWEGQTLTGLTLLSMLILHKATRETSCFFTPCHSHKIDRLPSGIPRQPSAVWE